MARISGINLPPEKNILIALTYVYGVGVNLSKKILEELNINPAVKAKDISETDLNKIREKISRIPTEGELRQKISQDIKRLQEIGSYRGLRHKKRLPVRGQRTKTNARTKRGKKVTVGSGKIKETKK